MKRIRQIAFLVGGAGERLGPLTKATPKPVIDVAGRPFLDYLVENAARFGFTDIVLLTGRFADVLQGQYYGRQVGGATIRCVAEKEKAGTAGALLNAWAVLDEEFVLCNGDSFFEFNFLALEVMRCSGPWLGKIALRKMQDCGRYGSVRLDGNRITSFAEKSNGEPGLVSAGIYVLDRHILDHIHALPCSIEEDVFPTLVQKGVLYGMSATGYFIDIGVPEDLERARRELPQKLTRPAVIFDRDGVLNEDPGYLHRPEDFHWKPGAREAIRAVNDSGWLAFVITNQAGVARGYYDEAAVGRLHDWMNGELAEIGAHIDAFYYCPHHPEAGDPPYRQVCDCRKPAPGMILRVFDEWKIQTADSIVIGDQASDVEAAQAAGLDWRLIGPDADLLGIVQSHIDSHTRQTR